MKIKILFFGISSDLVGLSNLDFEVDKALTVKKLKILLNKKYVHLKNLDVYAIAVNENYAIDDLVLKENDEVAIIPPVSGG
ncbi:MAG: MoaD/ThiS family protein [Polaribacter sp.]|jgi:molybdopterin converting factor subunit 1|nr:MoaD/ThiS family protein [Polaribacter sp.]